MLRQVIKRDTQINTKENLAEILMQHKIIKAEASEGWEDDEISSLSLTYDILVLTLDNGQIIELDLKYFQELEEKVIELKRKL